VVLHLDESFWQVVKLGNDTKMAVMGKENIKLQVNGTNQMITDVFYLPELKNNLFSIGQLQERNLAILMQHRDCKIYHHERGLIMSTQMSANQMFILWLKEKHRCKLRSLFLHASRPHLKV